MSSWIQSHKVLFLALAGTLMGLSFASAVRDYRRAGRRGGLVAFAVALAVTAALLAYNRVRYGFFL